MAELEAVNMCCVLPAETNQWPAARSLAISTALGCLLNLDKSLQAFLVCSGPRRLVAAQGQCGL